MLDAATALLRTFVATYAGYVRERVSGFDVDDAIAAGERWLEAELAAVLELPFERQRRSPLEVFREAMRFPTEALTAAGAPPVDRDHTQQVVLPDDSYALAPASSHDLGDDAWRAHLEWGAAKARALTPRPVVAYFGTNLMDRTAIEGPVGAAGLAMTPVGNAAELPGEPLPLLALVDLTHREADEAIRALCSAGVRTVGFGPHVDDDALVRARALGADEALPRSVFFRRLPELLPQLA